MKDLGAVHGVAARASLYSSSIVIQNEKDECWVACGIYRRRLSRAYYIVLFGRAPLRSMFEKDIPRDPEQW